MSGFKWKYFRGEIILGSVRCYCKYGISYRGFEEMRVSRTFARKYTLRNLIRESISKNVPFMIHENLIGYSIGECYIYRQTPSQE